MPNKCERQRFSQFSMSRKKQKNYYIYSTYSIKSG